MGLIWGVAAVYVFCWVAKLDFPLMMMALWSSSQTLPRLNTRKLTEIWK
jgi:hypothetical protein